MAAAARAPFVKICGVTDEAGLIAAVRAGADAIGLNFAPGTPRELTIAEGVSLAARARAAGGPGRPLIVVVTANLPAAELARVVEAVDPDAIQLSGDEPPAAVAAAGRPVWKALRVSADARAEDVVARAHEYLAAGATRVLLDAAGGPHPGGTGMRVNTALAAAVAREVPITLAGGLDPANVAEALLAIPAVGVDVASGTDGPRAPGQRPRKDPLRVALFVKRARDARRHRPNVAFGPTPVHPGLLEVDAGGRWGMERDFGGRYVPETLVAALEQLEDAYAALRHDPRFWAELDDLLARFAGRPTALYRADRLAAAAGDEARRIGAAGRRGAAAIPSFRLYLKREDLAHTGAHKINNALGQALLTRRLGKSRVIAETGAGQHGVATATACALLGLPCVVFMGEEDIRRQAPNVLRMRALGAEVRSVTSGTATLKDAVNEAMRDWVTNVETTHYVLGSAMGPHPYPTIVRDLQRRIGDEAAAQLHAVEGRLPDLALACVGGGSNAIGLLSRFIGEPSVRLAVAEAAGDGIETGRHAAAIVGGTPGILHGSRSLMLQDRDGQVVEAVSRVRRARLPGGRAAAGRARGGRPARGRDRDGPRGRRRDAGRDADGGHPAGARDGPRDRGAAQAPGGCRGFGGAAARGRDRPARVLRARRQGPRGARTLRRRRAVGGRAMTLAASPVAHTNDTAGARRIAAAFARTRAEGRAALIPYVVAGYPDADTSFEIACAAVDAGADLLEVGLPYSDPLADGATLQRASHGALAAGATFDRSLALVARIAAARPRVPLVAMGYANQLIGGGDGRDRAASLAKAGAAGVIVADLTPDEGAPFEAVAVGGRDRGRLPRRPHVEPGPARGRRGPERRVPVLRVAGRRHRARGRRSRRPWPGWFATVTAVSPVPVAVGFGVSKPAHVRAIARAGADGVIVASALVDALGPDGRDIAVLAGASFDG